MRDFGRGVRAAAASIAVAGALVFSAVAGAVPAAAHHGWQWAEKQTSELTGKIVSTRLGNPHGVVMMDVGGKRWEVEVGQPWRNARAGHTPMQCGHNTDAAPRAHMAHTAAHLHARHSPRGRRWAHSMSGDGHASDSARWRAPARMWRGNV